MEPRKRSVDRAAMVWMLATVGWMVSATSASPQGVTPGSAGAPHRSEQPDSVRASTDVAASAETEAPESLEDYLEISALWNPALKAAFEQWKGDLERVDQVRAYPDPRLSFAYYFRPVETRVGPQRMRASLTQTFPWFGKLSLRGDVAFEASETSRRRFEATKLRLFLMRDEDYYDGA